MDLSFLGAKINAALESVDLNNLCEIRLRAGFPIKIYYNGGFSYLYSVKNGVKGKIVCTEKTIEDIMYELTEGSLYAYNEEIKEGYITSKSGQRVGVAGEYVTADDKIKTVKNLTSLCVRIPHEIENCSAEIFDKIIVDGKIFNSLLISPVRYGKTTILKDLVRKLDKCGYNVAVLDERGEFGSVKGENVDRIFGCKKSVAFINALRALSPDVIVTDELANGDDYLCVEKAINSGVKIIASCHGDDILRIKNRSPFQTFSFERYFILGEHGKIGKLKEVYDGDFIKL